MKFRDSGMPDEQLWDSFFDPISILKQLEVTEDIYTLLDIGCGYGTFTIPAAKIVRRVVGIDIDRDMAETCACKLNRHNITNVEIVCGDIAEQQTLSVIDKYKNDIDYITLFNVLHCENPQALLSSAFHLLHEGGKIGVIHWIRAQTPRGPTMSIRPKPQQIIDWAMNTGLSLVKEIKLPPYHFGLIFKK